MEPGPFELNVEEFEPSPSSFCSGAMEINPAEETILGVTEDSISDGMRACLSGNASPGLWYSTVGSEGLTYRADTCSESTTFDTEISVYAGTCDGTLECITGNDDGCNGLASRVQWATEEGVVYFIKVHGRFSEVGQFGLTLQSFVAPDHDTCSDAQVVGPGSAVFSASTEGATAGNVPFCGFGSGSDPGVWYKLEGKGEAISISTCTAQTSLDGETGVVGLAVDELETVSNDFCQNAAGLELNSEVNGTTVGANGGTPYNECSFGVNGPDIWYSFEGNGDVVLLSVCSDEFSWTVSVFNGNCGALECVGNFGYDLCASIRFRSVAGETYYILMQGTDESQAGSFQLSLTSTTDAAVEGDACNGAIFFDLESDEGPILGSTSEAIQDLTIEDTCFSITAAGDVWYKVIVPEGGVTVVADTCDPVTDFDSQLSVFSPLADDGSCFMLECVTTNDDGCSESGNGSRVIWTAEAGKEYFIRVHGYDVSAGNFALAVQQQEGSSQKGCEAAEVIEVSPSEPFIVVGGSTIDGDFSVFPEASPCSLTHESTEAWYVVPGQLGEMSASTCSEGTNFDTILEVYRGSCDLLDCVGTNDDERNTDAGCSTVTWQAVQGFDYYVRVSGFSNEQGLFDLSLSLLFGEVTTARAGDGGN
ncbi:MAG: hypothetical protein SGILL_004343 [Bacillariaceae sp.]